MNAGKRCLEKEYEGNNDEKERWVEKGVTAVGEKIEQKNIVGWMQ